MNERSSYMPGVPCWIDSTQPDPDDAAAFYGALLGWEFEDRMPPDVPGSYLVGRVRGLDVGAIGSPPEGRAPAASWTTYVAVESADDAAARATAAGGRVVMEPFDVMKAGRMAVIADTEGATIAVWQARETIGAELVNEPGTWNFSGLHVRDVEAARAFYGDVFGWVLSEIEGGEASLMWRLPGYGDYLERDQPGLQQQMAEMGAPEGFADVVAMLIPETGADAPPPYWDVTFSVESADETAERARTLGGTVLVPPTDAPWVRFCVIRDPQGAHFVASQFAPPEGS